MTVPSNPQTMAVMLQLETTSQNKLEALLPTLRKAQEQADLHQAKLANIKKWREGVTELVGLSQERTELEQSLIQLKQTRLKLQAQLSSQPVTVSDSHPVLASTPTSSIEETAGLEEGSNPTDFEELPSSADEEETEVRKEVLAGRQPTGSTFS